MTKDRTLPEVHRNIIPPYADFPILDFYKGYYDCVYIILHPFEKCNDIKKFKEKQSRCTKRESTESFKAVTWNEVLHLSGFKDLKQVDIALRNSIGGLSKPFHQKEQVEKLEEICELHDLFIPPEGNFSDLLVDDMLNALTDCGHDWIYAGDEFGQERKMEFVQDIVDNNIEIGGLYKSWYTVKNEILFTTHWDSHFTFLCADRQTIEKILARYRFEGFYCDEKTRVYWSLS